MGVGFRDGFGDAFGDAAGEPDGPGPGELEAVGFSAGSSTFSRMAVMTESFVAQTRVAGSPSSWPGMTYIPRMSCQAGLAPASRYCSRNVPLALSYATTRALTLSQA